jgi:hypothetical protein
MIHPAARTIRQGPVIFFAAGPRAAGDPAGSRPDTVMSATP